MSVFLLSTSRESLFLIVNIYGILFFAFNFVKYGHLAIMHALFKLLSAVLKINYYLSKQFKQLLDVSSLICAIIKRLPLITLALSLIILDVLEKNVRFIMHYFKK